MAAVTSGETLRACFATSSNFSIPKDIEGIKTTSEFIKALLPINEKDTRDVKSLKATLFFKIDPIQKFDDETVRKILELSKSIRNANLISQDEKVPSILFGGSSYWRMVYQNKIHFQKDFIQIEQEEEAVNFLLRYLHASDQARQNTIDNLTPEKAWEVMFLADKWEIKELVEACDQLIAKRGVINQFTYSQLNGVNLHPFPYLRAWISLFEYIWYIQPDLDCFDPSIQESARGYIDFSGQEPKVFLNEPDLITFYSQFDESEAYPLSFSFDETLLKEESVDEMEVIGRLFKCHDLLESSFEFQAGLLGSFKKVESDEYISSPNNQHYLESTFFSAPCPVEGAHYYLTPNEMTSEVLSLINRYSNLQIGLSLKTGQIDLLAEQLIQKQHELPSFVLLELVLDPKEFTAIKRQDLETVLRYLPNLSVLVIPEEVKSLLVQNRVQEVFHDFNKLSFWKNLEGDVKRIQCGTERSSYEAIWKKTPREYPREEVVGA